MGEGAVLLVPFLHELRDRGRKRWRTPSAWSTEWCADHRLVRRGASGRGTGSRRSPASSISAGRLAASRPRPALAAIVSRFPAQRRASCSTRQAARPVPAAARPVQGDRRPAPDRLDFDAQPRRPGQSRALQLLQRLLAPPRRSSASRARAQGFGGLRRDSGDSWPISRHDLFHQVSETSAPLPRGESEFGHAGLTMAPCRSSPRRASPKPRRAGMPGRRDRHG